MATETRHHSSPVISPVLPAPFSTFLRHGTEGTCFRCGDRVRAHFAPNGTWLGCAAPGYTDNPTFVLLPIACVTRPVKAPVTRPAPRGRANAADGGLPPIRPVVVTPRPRGVVYKAVWGGAKDSHVKTLSEPLRKVYAALRRRPKTGLTRGDLLKALRASVHTGRVDGAIRRLRLAHLVRVDGVRA